MTAHASFPFCSPSSFAVKHVSHSMPPGVINRALHRRQDKKTHLSEELERVHQAGQELRAQAKSVQAKITHDRVRFHQLSGALTGLSSALRTSCVTRGGWPASACKPM